MDKIICPDSKLFKIKKTNRGDLCVPKEEYIYLLPSIISLILMLLNTYYMKIDYLSYFLLGIFIVLIFLYITSKLAFTKVDDFLNEKIIDIENKL